MAFAWKTRDSESSVFAAFCKRESNQPELCCSIWYTLLRKSITAGRRQQLLHPLVCAAVQVWRSRCCSRLIRLIALRAAASLVCIAACCQPNTRYGSARTPKPRDAPRIAKQACEASRAYPLEAAARARRRRHWRAVHERRRRVRGRGARCDRTRGIATRRHNAAADDTCARPVRRAVARSSSSSRAPHPLRGAA